MVEASGQGGHFFGLGLELALQSGSLNTHLRILTLYIQHIIIDYKGYHDSWKLL